MRGDDQQQSEMFSYVCLQDRVPQDHPLRTIRKSVDDVLRAMAKDFDGLYACTGRPSVPPERLLRAALVPCTARGTGRKPSSATWATC